MPLSHLSSIVLLGASLPTVLHGFVVRSHIVVGTTFWTGGAAGAATSLASTPNPWAIIVDNGDVHIIPDTVSMIMTSAASTIMTADESIGGAVVVLDMVKNIALAIVVIGGILAALAYVFATYLIPQAAIQLEAQAKEVDPELWREYQRKMEPGESLVMRPDLMQELGVKVREKIIAKFDAAVLERQEAEKAASSSSSSSEGVSTPSSSSNNNNNNKDGIMDATIISKEESRQQD